MKSLIDFLNSFLKNNGQYVFVSLLIAKICAFASAVLIVRILPIEEFGVVSIAASVFAIFAPFNGFGSPQSLLRFGSITSSTEEKEQLISYLFKKGFGIQIFVSIAFFLCCFFYIDTHTEIVFVFLCFAIRLFGLFIFSHVQSVFRVSHQNKKFAFVNNIINISTLVLIIGCSYSFGLIGYLVAISLAPFISCFWLDRNQFRSDVNNIEFSTKDLKNYALHSAGTASLSDALFSLDIILLSFLIDESAVAHYKVAILIPANISFLSITFMQTDFPSIAQHFRDKRFLVNYIVNYYKIFIPICILIFMVGGFWSTEILEVFFGARYAENSFVFNLLLAAFCLNMLFRNLFGNLSSAVGMMKFNTVTSVISLFILVGLSFVFVPKFGVEGMAISVCATLVLSGFILGFYFIRYLKTLK